MGRAVLFLVSGFMIIFGMVQNSIQNRQQVLAERSPEYYHEGQSRNIAASMMEVALAKYNNDFYWSGNLTQDPILGGTGTISVDSTAAFGSRVYLSIQGIVESNNSRTITTIKATANRPAFSIYSYFTAEEPSYIAFGSSDTLKGPVHTNGTFHMRGDPVFNGRVTSPNMWEDVSHDNSSDPEFKQGANFSTNEIPLDPSLADNLSINAENGGLRFDDRIKINFLNDGTADVSWQTGTEQECVAWYETWDGDKNCYRTENVAIYSTQNYNLAEYNGIISSSKDVEVKGTVKGNYTVHSDNDIHITGDIMYEDYNPDDPTAELTSDNLLGIVSEDDIFVDREAHLDNGDSDLNITASVMAIDGSFEVEGYDRGNPRGQLRILGGLIQKTRGAVATGNSSGISTGFSKNYIYDERLLVNSTPDFPKVKRFQIESWRESTEKEELN